MSSCRNHELHFGSFSKERQFAHPVALVLVVQEGRGDFPSEFCCRFSVRARREEDHVLLLGTVRTDPLVFGGGKPVTHSYESHLHDIAPARFYGPAALITHLFFVQGPSVSGYPEEGLRGFVHMFPLSKRLESRRGPRPSPREGYGSHLSRGPHT